MTPSRLRATTVLERITWITQMLAGIRALPLNDFSVFRADIEIVLTALVKWIREHPDKIDRTI